MRRLTALFLLSVTTIAFNTGCRKNDSRDNTHAIALGAIPGSPGYEHILRGSVMAIESLNSLGVVKFELRLPPAGITSPVHLAEHYRSDPSVIAVIGHAESGNTIETVPVYSDREHDGANGVVLVSQMATSPSLSGISPWFFRVAPSDAEAARHTAQWVFDSLGARRAAVIYRNDSYGRDWLETFTTSFAKNGGAVISRDPYLTGETEWNAYASQLALQMPDVVLFPGDAEDCLALLGAMHERGISIPLVGGDGTEGISLNPLAINTWVAAFFRADRAVGEEADRFIANYRNRFHEEPDGFAALTYEATMLIGRTVAAGAHTRASLRLSLEDIGNQAPSRDGVIGRIAFDKNHDIRDRPIIITRAGRSSGGEQATGKTQVMPQ